MAVSSESTSMTDCGPILTAAQVANLLRCSERTVEEYARDGRIPGAKFGDGWVFAADLVVEAVKKISLEAAAERRKAQQPAGVKVEQPVRSKRKPPGLKLLPQHAVRQILSS
jgi:excisionase family DNA binding protein